MNTSPTQIRRIRQVANAILEQIADMQDHGYYVGSVNQGRLPQVRSFSELHDYFDANVGWCDEWDALADEACRTGDFETLNAVVERVDATLREQAGLEPIYAYAGPSGLRVEDPISGSTVLSRDSFDQASADAALIASGRYRFGEWEVVIDGGEPVWRAVIIK